MNNNNVDGNQNKERESYKRTSDDLVDTIVRLRTQGKKNTEISTIVGRAESTIRGILKRYDEGSLKKARGGAHNVKCTPEIRNFVEEILLEDCTKTLKSLKVAIQERFGLNLAISTVFKTLGFINFF